MEEEQISKRGNTLAKLDEGTLEDADSGRNGELCAAVGLCAICATY
jgi:hypothetical protein